MAAQFIYAYDLDGGERRTQKFTAGGAIPIGTPVKLSSGKVVKCAAADSSLVVGVAVNAAAADGDVIEVITNRRAVYKCQYTPGTKTSLATADIGTVFDYDATNNKINLDDTTGGFFPLVNFNNTGKYAWVTISDGVHTI